MSLYDDYANEWGHIDEIEDVTYTPFGTDGQPDVANAVANVKAHRGNVSAREAARLGGVVGIEVDDQAWILFDSTMDGKAPQRGAYFVDGDSVTWIIRHVETAVFGTRYKLLAGKVPALE